MLDGTTLALAHCHFQNKETNDSFHCLDHRCRRDERCRSTSHQTITSGSFMADLTLASNHMAFRKSAISPIYSIVVGIMLSSLTGCGAGGEGGPAVSTSSTPTGATASLAWDPVQDPTVTGYFVHYGKQSTGQAGSCTYEDSFSVPSPSATVVGLDPDTRYYFSVSAFNGLQGPCSNEVSTVTPPAQT